MHNTIYQIKSVPIASDNFLKESDFYDHWFLNTIADYVDDDVNREDCIAGLKDLLEHRGIAKFAEDNMSFVLLPDAQKNYFGDQYSEFAKAVMELAAIKETEYLTAHYTVDSKLNEVRRLFSDRFDDYVSSDEFETIPFDEFIRKAEINTPYYIGGVIDYHW